MLTCDALLPLLDARVETILSQQVLDRSRTCWDRMVSTRASSSGNRASQVSMGKYP